METLVAAGAKPVGLLAVLGPGDLVPEQLVVELDHELLMGGMVHVNVMQFCSARPSAPGG